MVSILLVFLVVSLVSVLSFWLFGLAVGFSDVLTLADESERTAGKSVQEKD